MQLHQASVKGFIVTVTSRDDFVNEILNLLDVDLWVPIGLRIAWVGNCLVNILALHKRAECQAGKLRSSICAQANRHTHIPEEAAQELR